MKSKLIVIFLIGCLVVFIIILICIIVPYAFISYYENTDGYNIASTSGWTFFLLLNAFYGGALTMFFTSEIRIPFTSIEDVMKQYPAWRLLMMKLRGIKQSMRLVPRKLIQKNIGKAKVNH